MLETRFAAVRRAWEPEIFARSIVTHSTTTRPSGIREDLVFKRTKSLSELRDDGSIFTVEELLPAETEHNAVNPATVEFHDEERELLMRMRDYLKMLERRCGVSPPLLVGLSLLRPAGMRFHLRKHHGLRQLRGDTIADFVTIPAGFDLTDPAATIRQIAKAILV